MCHQRGGDEGVLNMIYGAVCSFDSAWTESIAAGRKPGNHANLSLCTANARMNSVEPDNMRRGFLVEIGSHSCSSG